MRTTLTVDDDGVITFPNEMMEKLGWKEGDVLEWINNKDGSFSLVKPNEHS
jgi:bifunctional DNA-binding transcriptional regulator/antitoxin component of YhaV-PrlF toxin-antitoxin module